MQYVNGQEQKEAEQWMNEAAGEARKALCLRSKCGTVIVRDGVVIGRGYNAPPLDKEEHRTCLDEYRSVDKKNFDRTCCIHAEWRAIIDTLKTNSRKIVGSRLYFIRVDGEGNIKKSGKPYCTVCSRLALDVGIERFLLWNAEGICSYPTDEYNRLSYDYFEPKK